MTAATGTQIQDLATSTGGRRHQVVATHRRSSGVARVDLLDAFPESGTAANPWSAPFTDGTSSGPKAKTRVPAGQTTAEALLELRRRSGLTWELLSELFSVSRRTVHHWANSKAPSAEHELEIRRTLDAIRHIDEGNQRATRDRLLTATNGLSPFDLLISRRYADVLRLPAGAAPADAGRRRATVSEEERARRRPAPPELLLDAIQDRPTIPVGKARIVRPARRKTKPTE